MTIATKKSGQMIGLLVLSGVFALWFGLIAYFAFGLNHGVFDAFRMTFPLIWWPGFAFILGNWFYNRRHKGRILMDCGPLRRAMPQSRTSRGSTGSAARMDQPMRTEPASRQDAHR